MREELNQKYEDIAWGSATKIIGSFLEVGKIDEAKHQAQEAIINWQKEGKTEIVDKFKEWLKDKNINLD